MDNTEKKEGEGRHMQRNGKIYEKRGHTEIEYVRGLYHPQATVYL